MLRLAAIGTGVAGTDLKLNQKRYIIKVYMQNILSYFQGIWLTHIELSSSGNFGWHEFDVDRWQKFDDEDKLGLYDEGVRKSRLDILGVNDSIVVIV